MPRTVTKGDDPAFPCGTSATHKGMTKRELIAALLLAGGVGVGGISVDDIGFCADELIRSLNQKDE